MPITILDDLLNELDETVIFELLNPVDCDIIELQKEHTLTITDNDSPPEVCFAISTQQGAETLGTPSISVTLSAPSTLTCQIDYQDLLTGTAGLPSDYTIGTTGTIVFSPGDTVETLPLFIVNDVEAEADETINFALIGGSEVNCTIGACNTHTYTIKDYTAFEWLGLAGVGMPGDNIFWLNANQLTEADGADLGTFTDQSPNAQIVEQTTVANQPNLEYTGPNGKREIQFNGTTDVFDINDSPLINTATFYQSKSIVIAFSTAADIATRQMIYEQGGSTRGISIYIDNNELYFHIWSNSDDNGADSRWGVGSPTGAFFVRGGVAPSTSYVATFSYTTDGSPTGELEGFINGTSVGSVAITTVSGTVEPRLYAHADNGGLGDVIGSTRYHDDTGAPAPFRGSIQELVHYSDAPFNTTRRIIVENHMSVKYNVPLGVGAQKYAISYATGYESEIAGIGQFGPSDNHSDSRGTGMVRINSPNDLDVGDFLMWGHDNASLVTGLLPYIETIPGGVTNRLHRVWKASELTGDVGAVDMIWDLSVLTGYESFVGSNLVLLIDADDGDFSNAAVIETGRVYNAGTGELSFRGVNLNNDVWFTIGSRDVIGSPLPIELLGFTATPFVKFVKLDWETASETNNDYFTLEKSRDGVTFIPFATVQGAGNSSSKISYKFWDENPFPGLSYYRLKQTDFDGGFEFSDVESVYFADDNFNLYPNPANERITLSYTTKQPFTLQCFDGRGRLINVPFTVNDYRYELNTSSLASGIYFLRIVLPTDVVVKEFVIR